MYDILKHFHSSWAFLTLLLIVLFVVMTAVYAFGKKDKTPLLKKISLYTLIVFHVQFLVGIFLYFVSPLSQWSSQTMGSSINRFYALEHPMMMLFAVILVTAAHSKIKKAVQVPKSAFVLALVAFILVLSRIPWGTWLG